MSANRQNRLRNLNRSLSKEIPAKPEKKALWAYVNSPFVIWCLSTIVISVASFSYNYYQTKYTTYYGNEEKIRKLDLEIRSRLDYLSSKANLYKSDKKQFVKVLLLVNKVKLSEFPIGVAPEYQDRHIASLILELKSLVQYQQQSHAFFLPSPQNAYQLQLQNLQKAFEAAEKFIRLFEDMQNNPVYNGQLNKLVKSYGKGDAKFHGIFAVLNSNLFGKILNSAITTIENMKWNEYFTDLNLPRWGKPFSETLKDAFSGFENILDGLGSKKSNKGELQKSGGNKH